MKRFRNNSIYLLNIIVVVMIATGFSNYPYCKNNCSDDHCLDRKMMHEQCVMMNNSNDYGENFDLYVCKVVSDDCQCADTSTIFVMDNKRIVSVFHKQYSDIAQHPSIKDITDCYRNDQSRTVNTPVSMPSDYQSDTVILI